MRSALHDFSASEVLLKLIVIMAALAAMVIFFSVMAPAQINPHTQIRWPLNCNQPGMTYNFNLNQCIVTGPVGNTGDVQLNQAGAWATAAGFNYSFGTNTLSIPNLRVPGTSTLNIPPTQVTWPPSCATGVYSPATNTCVTTTSSAGGPSGAINYNSGGVLAGSVNGTLDGAGNIAALKYGNIATPLTADAACAAGQYWIAPVAGSTNKWRQCSNGQVGDMGSGGVGVVVDTATPVTVSASLPAELHYNQQTTASAVITYNLPTASPGKQFCFSNSNNGSAANTGRITIQTSAAGQFLIYTDGTLSATGGYVLSDGAAGDAACVVGVDATHWAFYIQRNTWSKH